MARQGLLSGQYTIPCSDGQPLTGYFQADIVWNLLNTIFWDDEVLGQSATPPAQTDESIAVTTVRSPIVASSAITTIDDGLNANPISSLKLLVNALSELFYSAAELVAECERH